MNNWYCFKDKVKMVESEVTLSYLSLTQDVPGMTCPKCGAEYLTEKTVMQIVMPAEDALEQK